MKIGYTHIFRLFTTQYPIVKSTDPGGGFGYVSSLQ